MARNGTTGQPTRYGAEKLPTMRGRWTGAAGAALREMGSVVWPETPLPALMGVTSNATSETERYCDSFCAVGLFQIPEATWTALRTNAQVRSLLSDGTTGRDAVPVAEFADHVYDQVATGIVSLRRDLAAVTSGLDARLRPTDGSQWQLALAIMAYVVGATGAKRALARFVDRLAAVPEAQRFGVLAALAAADGSHDIVYPVTRTWQRLAAGRALSNALGGGTSWYDVPAGADVEAALAAALYGPGAAPAGGSSGGALLLAAVVAAGAWWWLKK